MQSSGQTAIKSGLTATVVGATGLVGKALTQQLLAHPDYSEVTIIVRRELVRGEFVDPLLKLRVLVINFDDFQDYQGYFSVDHVSWCLGTTIK
jgi:N-acetyl-gamma-glutamylphosphate reductase